MNLKTKQLETMLIKIMMIKIVTPIIPGLKNADEKKHAENDVGEKMMLRIISLKGITVKRNSTPKYSAAFCDYNIEFRAECPSKLQQDLGHIRSRKIMTIPDQVMYGFTRHVQKETSANTGLNSMQKRILKKLYGGRRHVSLQMVATFGPHPEKIPDNFTSVKMGFTAKRPQRR